MLFRLCDGVGRLGQPVGVVFEFLQLGRMLEEILVQHFGDVEVESRRIVVVSRVDADIVVVRRFETLACGRETGKI